MIKKIKEKKAASLMMVLGYSVVLFGLSGLLISILISSQKFVGISEKYNMAIYAAEGGIEQGLFELNIHDIGFNDSTDSIPVKNQNGTSIKDGLLQLNGNRLHYKWGVKSLKEETTGTGYLVWKGNINNVPITDSNRKFYNNFRIFYFYRDEGNIGGDNNIQEICKNDQFKITLSVDGSSVNPKDDSTNIVNWRIDLNEVDKSGTGYYLESNSSCNSGDSLNPFCYNGSFNRSGELKSSDSSSLEGKCFSDSGDDCKTQTPTDFLNAGGDPINDGDDIYKPHMQLTYQNELHEGTSDLIGLPIKYVFETDCTDKIPSLVQEIKSTGQTYGSVQTITTKIYQGNQGIDLSYTIIQ